MTHATSVRRILTLVNVTSAVFVDFPLISFNDFEEFHDLSINCLASDVG